MTLRKLGTWAILCWDCRFLFGPQSGRERSRDTFAISQASPQMGAVVQILGAANRTLTVFTDEAGYYTATGLLPGLYTLKVTAPSFLPALREKVGLRPGASS